MTYTAYNNLGDLVDRCEVHPTGGSVRYTYRPGNGFTYNVVVTQMPDLKQWLVSWYYICDKGWQSFVVEETADPLMYRELGDHLYRGKDFYVFADYLPMLAFMGQISKRPVVMPDGWTAEGLNKDKKRRVWPPPKIVDL